MPDGPGHRNTLKKQVMHRFSIPKISDTFCQAQGGLTIVDTFSVGRSAG
jgi:hypothetical protein